LGKRSRIYMIYIWLYFQSPPKNLDGYNKSLRILDILSVDLLIIKNLNFICLIILFNRHQRISTTTTSPRYPLYRPGLMMKNLKALYLAGHLVIFSVATKNFTDYNKYLRILDILCVDLHNYFLI